MSIVSKRTEVSSTVFCASCYSLFPMWSGVRSKSLLQIIAVHVIQIMCALINQWIIARKLVWYGMRNTCIERYIYLIVKTLLFFFLKLWFNAILGLRMIVSRAKHMGNLKFYDIRLTWSMVSVDSYFQVILLGFQHSHPFSQVIQSIFSHSKTDPTEWLNKGYFVIGPNG